LGIPEENALRALEEGNVLFFPQLGFSVGEATMEAVVAPENMLRALRAVERNAGAAVVDGMTTEELTRA
jgi:hypothetical protein